MVDQLRSFASEVTRVAREVGTEGKLGGQADVQGVAGTWKDLTDNVNFMKGDRDRCLEAGAWDYLSKPVNTENLLAVLRAWLPR